MFCTKYIINKNSIINKKFENILQQQAYRKKKKI
jgi:hypothetical protein